MMTLTRLLKCPASSLLKSKLAGIALLLFSVCSLNAQVTVSGTVTAADSGMSLPMANVVVKGTSNGISTDIDGKYSIAAKPGDVLVFSYIGFVNQEINVTNQTVVNVKMVPDANTLNEVVVIGYGTQKKADLTGSIGVVDVEDAKKTVTYDVAKMLQGQVAGVTVSSSGEPGGFVDIKIRGASSFTNNNPVFIIDGIIVEDPYDFAPGDIESIQVLKDASSAAIYGVRGARGVIIITTKKGRAGKISVNFKSVAGFQTVGKELSLTNREQYQQITNAAWLANPDNTEPLPGNDPNSPLFISDVDTDWQDEAFRTGTLQNQTVNISGGSELMNFSLSIDKFKNTSYMESPQDFNRTSANLNLNGKLGRLKFGSKMAYSSSNRERFSEYLGGSSAMLNLVQAIPTMPVYDPNRLGGYGGADNLSQRAITLNPIGWQNLVDSNGYRDRFIGNIWGEFEIVKGLRYTLRASADQLHFGNRLFIPPSDLGWYYITENAESSLDVDNGKNQRTIVDNLLNYDATFGKHKIEALAGWVQERSDYYRHWGRGVGFEPGEIAHLDYAEDDEAGEYESTETRISFLARINYDYNDRYLLQANWRQDKTSLFREQINKGDFYSFSGAWKLHNDIKLPSWWNTAKIRAGYGKIGNNTVPIYYYSPTVNAFAGYNFGNALAPGVTTVTRLDPNITWETTTTVNGAVELGMFNNKLQLTAEYFVKTSDDVLAAVPLPLSTGSFPANITTNAAKIRNKGFEFVLSYNNNDNDFKYGISANVGTLKNEVLEIGEDDLPITYSNQNSRTEVGRSLGEIYAFETEGIFQNQAEIDAHAFQANAAPGDVKFRDVNGDGQINDEDRTFQGTTIPKINYGLNLNASYKGFDLSLFFQGAAGHKIYNGTYNSLMIGGLTNHHTDMLDYWSPDNTDTNVPRPTYLDLNGNARGSDRFIEKGDYVRLQAVEFGYTLPPVASFIQKARIYVSGQNLFTITDYSGYDPDFNNGTVPGANLFTKGYELGSFPNPRGFMFGVDITL